MFFIQKVSSDVKEPSHLVDLCFRYLKKSASIQRNCFYDLRAFNHTTNLFFSKTIIINCLHVDNFIELFKNILKKINLHLAVKKQKI